MGAARVAALTIAALALLAVVFGMLLRPSAPVALHGSGSFRNGGAYPSANAPTGAELWGSWSGSDANTGVLTSATFRAPLAVSIFVCGGTGAAHTAERIRLQRLDSTAHIEITTLEDAGERWTRMVQPLPASWWGHPVQLIAGDRGAGYRGWLGIADVTSASGWDLIGVFFRDLRVTVMLLVVLFVAGVCVPANVVGASACGRLGLPAYATFPLALGILGLYAELVFFAGRFSRFGQVVDVAALIVLAGLAVVLAFKAKRRLLAQADVWMPLFVAFAAAEIYFALLAATTAYPRILTPVAAAAAGILRGQPDDNQLPHLLAQQVFSGAPPRPFVGDWLSSDRPPLQAGFDLLFGWIVPGADGADGFVRYAAVATTLQCFCFAAMWPLARWAGCSRERALAAVALCVPTGFFFYNALYTWPKLLAAAFVLAAMVPVLATWKQPSFGPYILAGVLLGLAMLSHGGVAFTIIVLALACLAALRFRSLPLLGSAALAALAVNAPWTAYQRFYDPPGDRLLKWQLAGHIPPDPTTPFLKILWDAYTTTPPATILANKLHNLVLVIDPQYGSAGGAFFHLLPALGIAAGPLAWLLIGNGAARCESRARTLAFLGLASVAVWICLLWSDAVVHQGSYATVALLMLSGTIAASRYRTTALYVFLASALVFTVLWYGPAANWSVFLGEAVLLAVALTAGVLASAFERRMVSARAARPPTILPSPNRGQ